MAGRLPVGAVGHPVVQTPTLDRLAAGGVAFTRTGRSDRAVRSEPGVLHTGMYLQNHRSVGNGTPLDARFTNMALEARAAGYDPVLFGYTDATVDPRTVADPTTRGCAPTRGCCPASARWSLLTGDDQSSWARWLADHGLDVPADRAALFDPRPDYPGADDHGATWAPTRSRPSTPRRRSSPSR